MSVFDPRTFSTDWEIMVSDKLNRTVDARILEGFAGMLRSEFDLPICMDCASSRRLLAEVAVFTAAYLHHLGKNAEQTELTPESYREYLTNRWCAARYGLQATFSWDGKPRTAVDVISEMLDQCAVELTDLGAKRSDLGVLNAMLDKRVCQADFALDLSERYPDRWLMTSAYNKLVRHWEIFEDYLESANALDPIPLPTEDEIAAEHLAYVGEGTHFYLLRSAMWYPAPLTDAIIERLVKDQRIRREVTEKSGLLLHRVGSSS